MPVAKIHVHEGAFKDSELAAVGTAVQAALEEVLSVPPEDYFRITHVLPKGQFVHTPAFVGCTYSERFVLLELTFISGRPKEKRLALLAALNRLVVEKVSLRPDDLVVLIYEMPRREHLLWPGPGAAGAHLGLSSLCARSDFIRLARRRTVRVGTIGRT
jgi:hypothetical protein